MMLPLSFSCLRLETSAVLGTDAAAAGTAEVAVAAEIDSVASENGAGAVEIAEQLTLIA